MQQVPKRRSNQARTEATRAALIEAARTLFVEKGYQDTGTPEIVVAAKVTRGALYHHFADKAALFEAVVETEARAVAREIEAGSANASSALDGLKTGADAYFEAMSKKGRVRLMLLDGPSVLGASTMARIDHETGGGTLRDGLAALLDPTPDDDPWLDAIADLLAAAFDRAALAIASGAEPAPYRAAIRSLIDGAVSRKS